MLISIIIPVYNAGSYLERCLYAIKNQSYIDWSCVLVNDGSNDESAIICDKWAKEEPRIKVIHQENKGASIARQVGIAVAEGEYLSFVDADDVVEPDYLEKLYTALIENNTEIAACDLIKHMEGIEVEPNRNSKSRILEHNELHQRFFKYDFWGYPGKLYKREIFDGIYYPQATINEDYVVMAQLFHKCQCMAYVPIPLYHYMIHEGSLSNQQISARAIEELYNKKWVVEFYKKNDKQYIPQAEAQLTETCIKLIRMISEGKKKKVYDKEYRDMKSFLRSNLFSITRNPNLLLGLKIMAIKWAFA